MKILIISCIICFIIFLWILNKARPIDISRVEVYEVVFESMQK